MAETAAFRRYPRLDARERPVEERIRDYRMIPEKLPAAELKKQACRCLDCGIPFCHGFGCPLANRIPDFNELVCRDRWEDALELLHSTNNFPEFTGLLCPAPCETACTVAPDFGAVSIRQIELQLVERGWREGWIVAAGISEVSGKRVAVIGSGPAGLAAAQQLVRRGHEVIVFERDALPGGILRYGIPDFKLEKEILDRRLEQLTAEGLVFETGVVAGADLSGRYLLRSFDAVVLAAGSRLPRRLALSSLPEGVCYAMDYLCVQNRFNSGEIGRIDPDFSAAGKDVVVIGGGDTGSDCVGTARRQGARNIVQVEILPKPPDERRPDNPWPYPPRILRTSTSHREGCRRMWGVDIREIIAPPGGEVEKVAAVRLDWSDPEEGPRDIPDSVFEIPAGLVIIAAGFTRTEPGPLLDGLDLKLDKRGNIAVDERFSASQTKVFAAGDCVRGASLIVDAIDQGRRCAASVDAFLNG